jgi:shikimate kinase
MVLMNTAGRTVYLKMTPAKLIARLMQGQSKRPILRGMDSEQILAFVEKALPLREPFYMQASMVVDCDSLGDDSICRHVADYALHCAKKLKIGN